jgi:UDPglucose 6-dehydrogenase
MRVGIIGYGFVGQAIAQCHDIEDLVIRDPKLEHSADYSEFNNCDVVFVCVPSPSRPDGSCDTTALEETVRDPLFLSINKQIPIICKTTAPPSVYDRLQKQYPNIVHCPEFLTAANAHRDYVGAEYCVIGGDPYWCQLARTVIQEQISIATYNCIITDIKTAAFYKYMMNCYLAAKVTFMNEFYQLAEAEGVRWDALKKLSKKDSRIGRSHMDVPGSDGKYGWGGACFPKDMAAIINEAKSLGVDFKLLEQIQDINKEHRNNG